MLEQFFVFPAIKMVASTNVYIIQAFTEEPSTLRLWLFDQSRAIHIIINSKCKSFFVLIEPSEVPCKYISARYNGALFIYSVSVTFRTNQGLVFSFILSEVEQ